MNQDLRSVYIAQMPFGLIVRDSKGKLAVIGRFAKAEDAFVLHDSHLARFPEDVDVFVVEYQDTPPAHVIDRPSETGT